MGCNKLSKLILCVGCKKIYDRESIPIVCRGLSSIIYACITNLHAECLEKCLSLPCRLVGTWLRDHKHFNNLNEILYYFDISYKNRVFSIDKFIDIFFVWNKYVPPLDHYRCINGIFGLDIPEMILYPLMITISDKLYFGKKFIGQCPDYIYFQLTINRPDIYYEDRSASNLLYIVNLYYYVPYDIWHMIAEFTCEHKLYHILNFRNRADVN